MKRSFSIVMVLILCLAASVPSLAAEIETDKSIVIQSARAVGYGQGYGNSGSFNVSVPSNGSTGKITIRITSPNQNHYVYFKVTDPNGRIVWNRSTFDTVGHMGVLPQGGAEIISPTFSNAISGNYTVTFTCLSQVTIDCWVYNW